LFKLFTLFGPLRRKRCFPCGTPSERFHFEIILVLQDGNFFVWYEFCNKYSKRILMTEKLYPAPKSKERTFSFFYRGVFLFVVACLVCLTTFGGWWLAGGRVSSASATLDAELFPVVPEFSARLEEIKVKEGERVTARQAVGRMDTGMYLRRLRESVKDAAILSSSLMEETAARLRALQDAEKTIVEQLALARNEEDARRVIHEERVVEHVRAQLVLRAMDTQDGGKAVGTARYQTAKQAEAQARARMEAAKEDFERYSRMRAVADQELRRIREENPLTRAGGSEDEDIGVTRTSTGIDGILYAPVSGVVSRIVATPGQMVKRGQPTLLISPEGREAQDAVRILAYFSQEAKDAISLGQSCEVRIEEGGEVLQGEIVEIMRPRLLPSEDRGTLSGADIFIPVAVRLKNMPKFGISPGRRVSCLLRTRHIFGFRGF
jgi:multidrug resistance efflux pump